MGWSPSSSPRWGDLGAAILAGVPEAVREQVEPFIPALVDAIHQALSLATSETFLVGVVASLIAAGVVLFLREAPREAVDPELEPGALEPQPVRIEV